MESKELRIGNWFQEDMTCGSYAQITAEQILDLDNDPLDDFYQPIPLTEDFVIDLGLKPVEIENGEWCYQDNKFRLNKNYSGFYYSRNLEVKYVHQLQNLYFALTGEELTINK